MSGGAWALFAVIGGYIWGGFALFLTLALRKERGKDAAAGRPPSP